MNEFVANPSDVKNFTQTSETDLPQEVRDYSEFLPAVNRTESLQRFFGSTVNQLLSSGSTQTVDAYWGRIKGKNYNAGQELYVEESDATRLNYQFQPGVISRVDNDVISTTSYVNSIRRLENLGANTDNHDKLFTEPGYTLDLPINIDMFINYSNYYWLEGDIPEIEIEATVTDPINIDNIIELAEYTTPTLGNYKSVKFLTGLRVKFTGDYISSTSGDYVKDTIYFVENVGEQIKLVEHIQPDGTDVFPDLVPYKIGYANSWDDNPWDEVEWDGYGVFTDPNLETLASRQDLVINKSYIVMERWAQDMNPWARSNKWYSIYALRETAAFNNFTLEIYANDKTRARRPVVEYDANMELYNTCKNYAGDVNYVISVEQISELLAGVPEFFVDPDNALSDGDIVLIGKDEPGGLEFAEFNEDFNSDFDAGDSPGGAFSSAFSISYSLGVNEAFFDDAFTVSGVGTSITLTPYATYNNDDFVIITEGVDAGEVHCLLDSRWRRAQSKTDRGTHPLFKLYDPDLVDLETFDDNNFAGEKIFGYTQRETGQFDRELGFNPGFAAGGSLSDYEFEFSLNNNRYNQKISLVTSEEIAGLYSWKDWVTNKYYNGWSLIRGGQRVPIVQTAIADGVSTVEFELGTTEISRSTEFSAIWDNPKASYRIYDHSYMDLHEIGGNNPTMVWKTDTDYVINEYYDDPSNDLVLRDPYDVVDANIVITQDPDNANRKTVNIDSSYAYSHLRYERFGDPENYGIIFLSNDNQQRYTIRKNGQLLQETTDYTLSGTTVTIVADSEVNDVFELEYIADADLSNIVYDVAPVHFYNTQNTPYTGSSFSNLLGHFRTQLEALPGFTGSVRGENNYHTTPRIHEFGGRIRQQVFSTDKFNYLLDQENINPLKSLLNVSRDYEQFKSYFRNKVQQLWKTEGWDTIRELVDQALTDIHIGKNRDFKYANSDMAYYRQPDVVEYSIDNAELVYLMPRVRNYYGNTQNHVYVYLNEYNVSEAKFIDRQLNEGIDFTIEGGNLILTNPATFVSTGDLVFEGADQVFEGFDPVIAGNVDTDAATLRIEWYSHRLSSHIPPSAVKLGFFKATQVEIIDGQVVGHDGSRIPTVGGNFVDLNAPNFDVIAAAVLELERRIYNGLVDAHFVQTDFLAFDMGTLYPRPGNQFGYSVADINAKIDDWASRYFVLNGIETVETPFLAPDSFTWNYSSVAPQPELASWRNIYVYYFGTDRPHSHPWEMLGHRTKPSWWDSYYAWTDAPRRAALANALANGITGDANGPDKIDVRFQRSYYDWTNAAAPLVDPNDASLRDPFEAGILPEPTDIEKQKPFVFGDWSDAEDEWRKSSEYLFALADAYLQLRPYSTFETYWMLDKWDINRNVEQAQWIDKTSCDRRRNIEIHNEVISDGVIESIEVINPGSGYSSLEIIFPLDGLCSQNAEAIAHLAAGQVTAVEIRDEGRSYLRAPTNVELLAPVSASGLELRYNIDFDYSVTHLGFNNIIAEEWGQENNNSDGLVNQLLGITVEYIMHVGGFTDKRIFNLELDGSYTNGRVILPPENYSVQIDRNPPRRSFFFSGVQLERTSDNNVKINGYNFDAGSFTYLLPSTGGSAVTESVGSSELTRYLKWHNEPTVLLYNTEFKRRQELYNFLIGLGEYYRSIGIQLPATWEAESKDAINWWITSTGNFYTMNGIDDELVFEQGTFGSVRTVDINYTGSKNILNSEFKSIKRAELLVLRDSETTSFSTKIGNDSIYGLGINVVDFEHMIVLENTSNFSDVIYDAVTGVGQNRIRFIGERTRNWNGRVEAPGYLVKDTGIILNMESAVREVERDWINAESKSLEQLTRRTMGFNVGYSKPTYLQNTFVADVSAYRFEKGERKYKGTETAIEAISRSKNIFGAEFEHQMYEDWMVRLGDFGDTSEREPLQFELVPDDIKSDPQHFRFSGEFVADSKTDLIIDLHNGAPGAVSGDFSSPFNRRDVLRLDETKISVVNQYQEFAKTAGLPLVDEIDNFIGTIDNISEAYDPTADYALIPAWVETSVYVYGDTVRYEGDVYQLNVASTGLNVIRDDIVLRGNQVFPLVANGLTFIANGETVTFAKTDDSSSFNEIVLTGTVSNPSTVADADTLVLDGVTINFSKTSSSTSYADIILDGSTTNPVIANAAGRDMTIYYKNDATGAAASMTPIVIPFDEFSLTKTMQQIWVAALTDAGTYAAGSVPDPTGEAQTRIATLEAFRLAYIAAGNTAAAWEGIMNNYYDSVSAPDRFVNPVYLGTQVAANLGAPWRAQAENLIQADLDLIADLSGVAATETVTSIVTGPLNDGTFPTTQVEVANNALDYNVNATINTQNLQNFVTFVEGNGSTAIATGQAVTVTNRTEYVSDNLAAIIVKINTAITNATLPATVDIIAENNGSNALRIRRFNNDADYRLGVEESITTVGFDSDDRDVTTSGTVSTVGENLTLSEVVDQINQPGIAGVSAASVSNRVEIRSTNQQLSVGASTALTDIGLSAGTYNATSTSTSTPVDLAIGDVVQQINDAAIANLIASQVQGVLILTYIGETLTIGAGTANNALGIIANEYKSNVESVSNSFNSSEWNFITDPANFNIWIVDNIGSNPDPLSITTNYQVYQTADFGIGVTEICVGNESGDDAEIFVNGEHQVSPGDYVLIIGTNSVPNADGIHKVTKTPSASRFFIDEFIQEKGNVGKIIPLRKVRVSNTAEAEALLTNSNFVNDGRGIPVNSYIYVDNYTLNGTLQNRGAAYQLARRGDTSSLTFIREELGKADNSQLKNAILYSESTNEDISRYEVYDPVTGFIPGIAEAEIDVRNEIDIASYNNTTDPDKVLLPETAWGGRQAGLVWWDLSNAIYLDYHQGDNDYRQAHWAELFPTATIDVYEWTKSPVTPDEYTGAVTSGSVIDGVELTGIPYSVTDNLNETQYYWTEDIELNPNTNQLETYYYFWVKNKTTIPNLQRQFSVFQLATILRNPEEENVQWVAATSEGTLLVSGLTSINGFSDLVLQVNFDKSDIDYHQEFILLPEGDPGLVLPEWLHISLRDSLAGFAQLTSTQSYTVWDSGTSYNQNAIVKGANGLFYVASTASTNVDPTTDTEQDNWYTFDIVEENPDGDYDGTDTVLINTSYNIPDLTLHPYVRQGIETRPHQIWFVDSDKARRALVEKINSQLLPINLVDSDIPWKEEFSRTVQLGSLEIDLTEYWDYTSWTLPGGPAHDREVSDYELQTVDGLAGLTPAEGEIAHVVTSNDDDGINRHTAYVYQNSEWVLFYKAKATIQFNSLLWDNEESGNGWDTGPYDIDEWDKTGISAAIEIFDSFYNKIWIEERKSNYTDLWFHMVRYVLTEQDEVDWIYKTSYVKMVFEDTLEKNYSKYFGQNVQELFDYIDVVKPFRSKLRDAFTRKVADELFITNVDDALEVRVQTNPVDDTIDETLSRSFRLTVGSDGLNYSSQIVNEHKVLLGLNIGATNTIIPFLNSGTGTLPTSPGAIWINGERIEYTGITNAAISGIGSGFSSGFSSGFGGITLLTGITRGTQGTLARPHYYADIIEDETDLTLTENTTLSDYGNTIRPAWNELNDGLLDINNFDANGGAIRAEAFGTIDPYGNLFTFQLLALSENAEAIELFQSELEELIEVYWSTI